VPYRSESALRTKRDASGMGVGAGPPAPTGSRGRVELVVLVELSDAGGETIPVACIADQQDGCLTGRRRPRRQHVFDPEVPVRGERNRVRVALDEWSHGFTYERGALTTSPTCLHSNKMKIFSSRVSASAGHTPVIVRGERREVTQMKRAIFFALMLMAVLAPLAGNAYADVKSDEAIVQAP